MVVMHNPPHPGEVARELCIVPLGLTVTDAASSIGVSRKALSELLNGKSGISPEMALRLARLFGNTPEFWMNAQRAVDLWDAERIVRRSINKIAPLHAA